MSIAKLAHSSGKISVAFTAPIPSRHRYVIFDFDEPSAGMITERQADHFGHSPNVGCRVMRSDIAGAFDGREGAAIKRLRGLANRKPLGRAWTSVLSNEPAFWAWLRSAPGHACILPAADIRFITSGCMQPFGSPVYDPLTPAQKTMAEIADWFYKHPHPVYYALPDRTARTLRAPYSVDSSYSSIAFESTMFNYLLRSAMIANYKSISQNAPSPSPATDGTADSMVYENQATRGKTVHGEMTNSRNLDRASRGAAVLDGINTGISSLQDAASFMNKFKFQYKEDEFRVIDVSGGRDGPIIPRSVATRVLVDNMKAQGVNVPESLEQRHKQFNNIK